MKSGKAYSTVLVLLQTMADSPWLVVNLVAFNLVVVLLLTSHARAVFSDPGIVPLPAHPIDFSDNHIADGKHSAIPPPDDDWTICTRCEMYRPPRYYIENFFIYVVGSSISNVKVFVLTLQGPSLQNMPAVHSANGPPLSVDQ